MVLLKIVRLGNGGESAFLFFCFRRWDWKAKDMGNSTLMDMAMGALASLGHFFFYVLEE